MNDIEVKKRLLKGEDLHTEFKEIFTEREDIAKAIVCFANTDGGEIFVGVSDSGDIIGVENLDELIRKIDDVAFNRCEPPIPVIQETCEIDNKTILIIRVPKGDQRPYRTASGFFYIRSANRCRQASREELLRLFQATESIYYDETEISRASIKDIDIKYAKNFLKENFRVSTTNRNIIRYLINIKALSNNEKPTLAGLLFFGEHPQNILPYARIVSAYIEGKDLSTAPLDKKEFVGKVEHILHDCMKFLMIYIKKKHIIKGMEREEYPEIEDYVLREALVNSIAHRDYTISAPIRVLMFKDRIEFHSPGKLPNTVTIESMKLGAAHVLRNPTIYNYLSKMGLVTDLGSGIRRIIESAKRTTGKKPDLKIVDESEFILTIYRA